MGKWGCRGIPPDGPRFHHPLRMTADLKAHAHTLHTRRDPACCV